MSPSARVARAAGRTPPATRHLALVAPMPGPVVAVLVQAGDTVEAGQPLMVLEAMKMEHSVVAAAKGTVAEILYAVGERVAEGVELLRLEDVA